MKSTLSLEIQALLKEINHDDGLMEVFTGEYSTEKARVLKEHQFDRVSMGARGLMYEKLDQLTIDLLMGMR